MSAFVYTIFDGKNGNFMDKWMCYCCRLPTLNQHGGANPSTVWSLTSKLWVHAWVHALASPDVARIATNTSVATGVLDARPTRWHLCVALVLRPTRLLLWMRWRCVGPLIGYITWWLVVLLYFIMSSESVTPVVKSVQTQPTVTVTTAPHVMGVVSSWMPTSWPILATHNRGFAMQVPAPPPPAPTSPPHGTCDLEFYIKLLGVYFNVTDSRHLRIGLGRNTLYVRYL